MLTSYQSYYFEISYHLRVMLMCSYHGSRSHSSLEPLGTFRGYITSYLISSLPLNVTHASIFSLRGEFSSKTKRIWDDFSAARPKGVLQGALLNNLNT